MRNFSLLIVLFIVIVWIPVESAWSDFCFNNYDLGIYGQAIELLSWKNPNPWLSTRDVFLFNDHFDPILFLLVPLKGLLPSSLLAIRTEMLTFLLAAFAPVWLWKTGSISKQVAVACAAMILFSPMALDAAMYPAHPGTWSLAPLSWMFAFLLVENFRWALFMLALTLACKEEYPFLGIAIGIILYLQQKKRAGIAFLALSFAWAFLAFVLRPRMLGPANMYTEAVSRFAGISMLLSGELVGVFFKRLAEVFLPLLIILYGARTMINTRVLIPVLCLFILLGVRLAGGYWGNHRSAPLVIVTAYTFVYVWRNNQLTKKRIVLFAMMMVAFAFPSIELGSRVWRGKSFKRHCPNDSQRIEEIGLSLKTLRTRHDGPVLAQGNLIPAAVDIKDIAHVGATQGKFFRYLLLEKSALRNAWPLQPAELEKIESDWRNSPKVSVVFEGHTVVLLKTNP